MREIERERGKNEIMGGTENEWENEISIYKAPTVCQALRWALAQTGEKEPESQVEERGGSFSLLAGAAARDSRASSGRLRADFPGSGRRRRSSSPNPA